MNSSRTNLRLQLMREQSMHDQQQKLGVPESFNGSQSPSLIDQQQQHTSSTSPLAINRMAANASTISGGGSSYGSGNGSVKTTSPIIISQPIRFTGNRLVHLPPQIIHVQQQHQDQQHYFGDEMGRRSLTLSSSLPPGLPQNTPPKPSTNVRGMHMDGSGRVATPQQHSNIQQYRAPSVSTSIQSPAELSPIGYGDSPQSNSFTSAQSELDDIIIDEILSMEEEQRKREPGTASSKMSNGISFADNLETLLASGRNVPFLRQVSNSAPTSTIDIEGLVREELMQEQELVRDRRKKDIHNMIERRRRYNINDRIKELGTMLPKSCTEDLKLNKGTILKASVEYIRVLKRDQEKMHQMLQRYQTVDQDNKTLVMRIQELERRLKQNGIPVPPPESSTLAYSMSESNLLDDPSRLVDRPIKSEPLDDDQTPQPRPNHPAPVFHTYQQQHAPPPSQHQLPPLPMGPNIGQGHTSHTVQHPAAQPPQQVNRLQEYHVHPMSGHNYSISSDAHMAGFYSSVPTFGNDGGVLETPPVVNNNLSLFGTRRPPLGMINQHPTSQQYRPSHLQQHRQHPNELMMDLTGDHGMGGPVASSTVGDLISSSTAALISSSDPLMSDPGLMSSQIASPDVQWDSQTFSPEGERMDFMAQ